ncbi:MAG: peptide-methionine (S)-S-oxide reductase MsrA [Methanoregula sp.]|nr:MAG: peptide-methionine (S)-S-oxide reductase MsrA [Methanoregula sp.]
MLAIPTRLPYLEKATFGAGCFWGAEAAFRGVPGVTGTAVGYMGGTREHPSYRDVCTGLTRHAEVVEVIFDPGIISYPQLLDVFWTIHDPTTHGRQGVDTGSQYRSAIFYNTPEQKTAAEASREQAACSGRFEDPVVTEIIPAKIFWRAEDYHQRYYEKRGGSGCRIGKTLLTQKNHTP